MLMLGSALLAIAKLMERVARDHFQPDVVLRRIGVVIWIVLVFIGTFARTDIGDMNDLPGDFRACVFWAGPVLLATGAWLWAYIAGLSGRNMADMIESAIVVAVLVVLLMVNVIDDIDGFAWIVFNLGFLVMGGVTLSRGLNEVRWGLTALGTLMLAAMVFARFMDLFDSLLARSALFIMVGIGLFVVGQIVSRRKQRQRERASDA